jgi:hypothetical protein
MKAKLHAAFGGLALVTICCFWGSTVLSELFGDNAAIAAVKTGILWGMLVLVPAMAAAGGSGFSLGKAWRSPAVARKKLRMKIIAVNGILVLVPSAAYLAGRAGAGEFDWAFGIVQAIELMAGAVNITLLSLNMRDGFALRKKPARVRLEPRLLA